MKQKAVTLFMAIMVMTFLTSCGGTNSTSQVATGVFIDAPVEGIGYKFGNYSGITGQGGTFTYPVGSSGVFRLGDIVIGRATGNPVLTPLDLVKTLHPEYTDQQTTDDAVKLVQFLTSIGGGANQPVLTIPPGLSTIARGAPFASINLLNANLQTALDSLGTFPLISTQTARDHLTTSLSNISLARHAGEYVTVGATDEIFFLRIDSSGGLAIFDTGFPSHFGGHGTISPEGTITFLAQGRNSGYYINSGTSDGKGTVNLILTLTTSETTSTQIPLKFQRITSATNRFFGFYGGTFTGNSSSGAWAFGIDADGNMTGSLLDSTIRTNVADKLLGKADLQTGQIRLQSTASGLVFTGSISAATVTGAWTKGTSSGTYTGSRM